MRRSRLVPSTTREIEGLVQGYTGFVYRGPLWARQVNRGLERPKKTADLQNNPLLQTMRGQAMTAKEFGAKLPGPTLALMWVAEHFSPILRRNTHHVPWDVESLLGDPVGDTGQRDRVDVELPKSWTLVSGQPVTRGRLADGKTEVVKTVAAKGTGEREINPVKVSLALYDGDKKVTDVKPVALERGEAAVLYITGSGNSLSPVWVKRPASTR